jgi:hypothetical protein
MMLKKIVGVFFVAVLSIGLFPTAAQAEARTRPQAPTEAPLPCTISGSARNDVLRGTARNDVICGFAGADTIFGNGGNDVIYAGDGNDVIDGGVGNDTIHGGNGSDRMNGGTGNDDLNGDAGNDTLNGGIGHDVLDGDAGGDQIIAGPGDDSLSGGSGRDVLQPGTGDDQCAIDSTDITVGQCRRDITAPVFAPMALSTSVNAGETLTIEWVLTDASPVSTWLRVTGGPLGWVEWCGYDVFGSPVTQTNPPSNLLSSTMFGVRCTVPTNAVGGEYSVEIDAIDAFHNVATTQRIILTVNNDIVDTDAPVVSEVRVSTPVMNRLTNMLLVSFRVDDAYIIEDAQAFLRDSTGSFPPDNQNWFITSSTRTIQYLPVESGAAQAHMQPIILNAYTGVPIPVGTYTVWIAVRDVLGNSKFIKTDVTVEYQDVDTD